MLPWPRPLSGDVFRPARALGDLFSISDHIDRRTPKPAITPKVHPDTVTLNLLRKVLKEDQKILAGNPIVKQVVERYLDLAVNVDDTGHPNAQVEPSLSFREWINDLTVGHLDRIKKKRERERYKQLRKSAEKAKKARGQAYTQRTARDR